MPIFRPKPPLGYTGLMERMAQALGLDLHRDAERLNLSSGDVERLMRRCASCSELDLCRRYPHMSGAGGADPPGYCVNRKLPLFVQKKKRDGGSGPGKTGP